MSDRPNLWEDRRLLVCLIILVQIGSTVWAAGVCNVKHHQIVHVGLEHREVAVSRLTYYLSCGWWLVRSVVVVVRGGEAMSSRLRRRPRRIRTSQALNLLPSIGETFGDRK